MIMELFYQLIMEINQKKRKKIKNMIKKQIMMKKVWKIKKVKVQKQEF